MKEYYRCVNCKEITIYKKHTEEIISKGCDCGSSYLIPTTTQKV